ncbi:MAG: DNA polymerase III subunit delta [Alphaproteobacteria bacterium]|nr:DNA polymerase III subunit delta [Alphaproteobacteria bacterium]
MTALSSRQIADFVKRGVKAGGAVLIYGPDAGLVRERADELARRVVRDFKDPFNYIELSDADVKADPARLADEAAALSFAGGERVVRLKTAGEAGASAAKTLVDALEKGSLKSNALVLIEAGDLAKSSGLRKTFEKASRATALPCYADAPADIRALAVESARAEDLSFEPDALDLLVSLLGEDRGVSRSEVDKLIAFKGFKNQRSGPGTITPEDVRATLSDGVGDALDEAAAAAADGAAGRLARALSKSAAAGANPVTLIRALSRSFSRLREAQGLIAAGESAQGAMKRLRPPVFFLEARAFEARLHKWPIASLDRALDLLIEAELEAKSTGAPQREIAERAALRLALMAARRR